MVNMPVMSFFSFVTLKHARKTLNVIFARLNPHLIRVSGVGEMHVPRARRCFRLGLSCFPHVELVLDVFGEPERARERAREHEEECDHGPDEEGVQTPAPGPGLALDICGRGHLQKLAV